MIAKQDREAARHIVARMVDAYLEGGTPWVWKADLIREGIRDALREFSDEIRPDPPRWVKSKEDK